MIKGIINGIFKLVLGLVNVLLIPIDALISRYLPSLADALDYINDFFDYIGSFVPWVISYFGFTDLVLNTIILVVTFILTVPLLVHTVKLALSWYNKLKLQRRNYVYIFDYFINYLCCFMY